MAAVETYVDIYDLRPCVGGISARTDADISHLKPDPYLVTQAVSMLDAVPSQCLLVGDSTTDIQAARTLGVGTIAYANRVRKVEKLAQYDPSAIVTDMQELADIAVSSS